MAYVKTTWQTGDVITAEKLNKMEDGIEAGQGFFISGTWSEVSGEHWYTFDKTFTEIKAAMDAGIMPVVKVAAFAEAQIPEHYYTILDADFTEKVLKLNAESVLVARDEGENDIPVIAIE